MFDSVGHPSQSGWGLTTMASDGTGAEFHATGIVYSEPAWAPAGDRLLLVRSTGSSAPSAIFLASPDGTELGQVTPESTRDPDWSSRGQIAFTRSAGFPCRVGCDDIYVTRLGGTPRRLTYRGGYNPVWSPDGKWIAFIRHGDLHVVRTTGRGRRRLVDSPLNGLQYWGSVDWQAVQR